MMATIDAASDENAATHTLVVTLQNQPGALDRLVGLARRQGCTIAALSYLPSGTPSLDIATITLRGGAPARVAQLAMRLVDVLRVTSHGD